MHATGKHMRSFHAGSMAHVHHGGSSHRCTLEQAAKTTNAMGMATAATATPHTYPEPLPRRAVSVAACIGVLAGRQRACVLQPAAPVATLAAPVAALATVAAVAAVTAAAVAAAGGARDDHADRVARLQARAVAAPQDLQPRLRGMRVAG